MTGFALAAVTGVVAGLMIGAAATVGITLAVQDHGTMHEPAAPATRSPTGPYLVNYGERCWHGHCIPWP
ncbi:DUF2613 family protein [Mycobacterium sherrisii]|uniref:DUF2613 domain-containing protein n=1 Tax=Mycobacterium sherrisii TaxID=243061 RepID=A0A1E3SZ65_9MYCO|nr:DUF2613 family protein [Mycobacterium sherrisii]MCV7028152.1 DUF2613 domain-containing protein [Mycobacterium sherrisii]MEC4762687.1 DUF2613 family protein [Mycobacterium sherrisii]ODR07486.1 hypothetical protein BHQ21_08870 [Mycobacterium sherrisii]ORW78730.1 hypothetical protein AWC25_05640 [Mycobacterium sherrisii]